MSRETNKLTILLIVPILIGLLLAGAASNIWAQQEQASGAAALEWVTRENLSPELLASCPRSCSGMYLEQQRDYENVDLDPRTASIEVISDLSEIGGSDNIATMEGNVELTQGWRSVEADQVRILQAEDRIEMLGDIRMREPGMLITGRAASIESSSQALQFDEAEFVLHDIGVRGTADEVGRDANGRFYILNATYSTCEPGQDNWSLSASEISIDENQLFATARNMTIRIGKVPVFYAPWFAFPVGEGRQTGMLYPSVSHSTDNGLDVTQPVYLNLAPNFDMTLAPRYIENRGSGLEVEARYLNQRSLNQINTALLPDDKGGANNSRTGKDRWLLGIAHQGDWGFPQSFVDYNQVSDTDYFEDLGSAITEVDTRTYLKQFGQVSADTEHWYMSASLLRYQTIADDLVDSYRELPSLSFNGDYQWAGLNWKLNHQLVNFDHPLNNALNSAPLLQGDADGTWITGQRAGFDYSLEEQFSVPWGKLDAEVLSMLRLYQLDNSVAGYQDSSPQIQAGGIRLYSEVNFERRAELFGSRWIQSLEPSIQYLNVDAQSQNNIPVFDTRAASPSYSGLFRTNRFMGGDRISDANQITLGITGRLIDPVQGNQVARFSLGQTFYLEDREVHANELIQLGLGDPSTFPTDQPLYLLALETQEELEELTRDRSNLIAEAELRLSSEWIFTTDAHLNTSSSNFERGHINFSYLGSDDLSAFNVGYRYASDLTTFSDINGDNFIQSEELFNGNTSQYDVSGVKAVNENWTLVARWQQDIALDRALETLVGARYDTCCWSTGLYWRQWLRRDDDVLVPQSDLEQDSGIFISFELKGLAGVGQGIESLLEIGIPGYNRETF